MVSLKPDPALTLVNYSVVIHTTEFLLSVGPVMHIKAASKQNSANPGEFAPRAGQDVLSNDYHVMKPQCSSSVLALWLQC